MLPEPVQTRRLGAQARMLTYADVCRMLTYADVCVLVLTYADVYADVC
jgi:hypothetical protein